DDAVLFGDKQLVDKYGWNYLAQLVKQNPKLVRGVPGSASGVASGDYLASIAVGGDARPNGTQVFSDTERFNSWAQRGAIFKNAPHKAGAKLFMSWLDSQAVQKNAIATWTWSVRKDVSPPAGLRPLASYKNTDQTAFAKFMSDRASVERFRSQVELYFGQVKGADPGRPHGHSRTQPRSLLTAARSTRERVHRDSGGGPARITSTWRPRARMKLIHGVDAPDTGFGSRGGWRPGARRPIVVPTRTPPSGPAVDVRPPRACRAPQAPVKRMPSPVHRPLESPCLVPCPRPPQRWVTPLRHLSPCRARPMCCA
ncbi:hypothetical protein ACRJ4W_00040, partial [Streptomyces sp. GLT-R25]